MEYINANFWINDNFLILHFVNLIFIVFIFQIMYHFLFTKYYKFSLIFLFYGLLDNFGFGGGKNGFIEIDSIAKQDAPFAALFLLSSILLYLYINKVFTNIDNQDVFLLFIIVLFSVQMRPLGAINLIAFLLITVYKFRFNKTLLFIFKKGFMVTILGIFFMIKNIITSNCLLYPVDFLCRNSMPWGGISDYAGAKRERGDLAEFHVSLSSENFTTWFTDWSTKETNLQVFQNIVLPFSEGLTFWSQPTLLYYGIYQTLLQLPQPGQPMPRDLPHLLHSETLNLQNLSIRLILYTIVCRVGG